MYEPAPTYVSNVQKDTCLLYDPFLNVTVIDITYNEQEMDVAQKRVVHEYSRLAAENVSLSTVKKDLATDLTHMQVLASYESNPLTNEDHMVGITFIDYGDHSSDYPFEFMKLLEPENGWESFREFGFSCSESVEIKRTVVGNSLNPGITDQMRFKSLVLDLHNRSGWIAITQHNKKQMWAIMGNYVARCLRYKVGLHLIPGLRKNSPTYDFLFNRYPTYWNRSKPGLYKFCRHLTDK